MVNKTIDTFIGAFSFICTDKGIITAAFGKEIRSSPNVLLSEEKDKLTETAEIAAKAEIELREYFEGERKSFSLPLDLRMIKSDFQRRTLLRVKEIPFGTTITYGKLAKELGSVARAVGRANAMNPLPVIIPCHRVIGGDGSLKGFAGGLHIKEALLRYEGVYLL